MRIGILTYHYVRNHGARAQTVALYNIIRQLGHDCEIINYFPLSKLFLHLRPLVSKRPLSSFNNLIDIIRFQKHLSSIQLSTNIYNIGNVDNLGFDTIILGSDEIFNLKNSTFHPAYFGLGINKTRLITYAPSFGEMPNNTILPKDIKDSIKRISHISVRDINSRNIMYSNMGIDTPIVLDPTFLYDGFEVEIDKCIKNRPYLLSYILGKTVDEYYFSEMAKFAHDNGMLFIALANTTPLADFCKKNMRHSQWHGYFRNAAYVVTNSYHGVIFSIKNHKPFLVIDNCQKGNKINDILHELGIGGRIWNKENSRIECIMNGYDDNFLDDRIHKLKTESISYIKNAINS